MKDLTAVPTDLILLHQKLIDHIHDGLIIWKWSEDQMFQLILSNLMAEKITGLTLNKYVGQTMQKIMPEIADSEICTVCERVLRTEKSSILTYIDDRQKNKYSLRIVALDQKCVGVIYHKVEDHEDLIMELKERYKDIFENALDGIAVLNLSGEILDCNNTLSKMFQYSKKDLLNLPLAKLIHPDFRFQFKNLQHQINYKVNRCFECVAVQKNGHPISVEILLAHFVYEGEVALLVIFRDALERKQVEFAFQSRLNMLSEMATNLSHELNQPLAAIVNYAQGCVIRLNNGKDYKDELLEAAERIVKQAQRAAKIIQRLRSFVCNGQLNHASFSVDDLVKDALGFLDPEIERGHVKIVVQSLKKLPKLYADKIQLEQVIVNIIKNAVEVVKDEPVIKREITINAKCIDKKNIAIEICDKGKGISHAIAKRIFDPFFTTKPNGMGMGLAISRTIIEAHGGKLTYQSSPETGSCFIVVLPTQGE